MSFNSERIANQNYIILAAFLACGVFGRGVLVAAVFWPAVIWPAVFLACGVLAAVFWPAVFYLGHRRFEPLEFNFVDTVC